MKFEIDNTVQASSDAPVTLSLEFDEGSPTVFARRGGYGAKVCYFTEEGELYLTASWGCEMRSMGFTTDGDEIATC
jgi:hypothetical protein